MSAIDWLGISRIVCCCFAFIVVVVTIVFDHYRGFSEGYDEAKKTYTDWGKGFTEWWNTCRKYMVLNHAGNYNEDKEGVHEWKESE